MSQQRVRGEYAQIGIDYGEMKAFKDLAIATAKQTIDFPLQHDVRVYPNGTQEYIGNHPFLTAKPVLEGLGNKNWIGEWMRKFGDAKKTYAYEYAICNAMMAVNDIIVSGAMPTTYNDEVAADDSSWFNDEQRSREFFQGVYAACKMAGMALVGGESPALKFLVKSAEPVDSAPILSGCVTGIISPARRLIDGSRLTVGDAILGFASSGMHANGASLLIKRAMKLQDGFLAKLPNGNTLGDEVMIPTMCYVGLVKALLDEGIDIHAFQPGTGGGIAKIAFDPRSYLYRIHSWPEMPVLIRFLQEIGVSITDCMTTFNCGIGYYAFVPPKEVGRALGVAREAGYDAMEVGRVEEGERKTIFGPMNDMILPPPGE